MASRGTRPRSANVGGLASLANLKICRSARPRGLRRRSWRRSAAAPEWPPAQRSGGGHGSPDGRPPRVASGAREVRSLGASARNPRAVEPVGAAMGLPPGIIKSTSNGHWMSSSGSSLPHNPDRARPENLQVDVPDGRSQLLRATSEFRLGMGVANGGLRTERRKAPLTRHRIGERLAVHARSVPDGSSHEHLPAPAPAWA